MAAVDNKDAVLQRILGAKRTLVAMGVKSIGLSCSFVRDEASSSSDVDILVEFRSGEHSFDNFMDVCFFLEELLERRVELVTPEALSPHLGPHILREVQRVDIAA